MKLNFTDEGRGFPVILLHAFPLSRRMWEPQRSSLINENFRLILPDLPGFGLTKAHPENNSMLDMARDVEELLDFLKIEKALIGGLSMGGYVALNLFPLCSQRFAGLILCDTTSSADNQEKRKTRKKLIEEIILHGIGVLKTKMLPNLISGITQKNNPQLIAQLEKEIAGVSPDAAISALRGMAERDDQTNSLTKIDVPTLLIFGAEDQITDLEAAHILQQKISNSELFILEKAGHLSNLEQPEKFNKAVLKFCKKISS